MPPITAQKKPARDPHVLTTGVFPERLRGDFHMLCGNKILFWLIVGLRSFGANPTYSFPVNDCKSKN
jgi:hypothetical protein